jgi:hypothetical protein
MKRNPIKAVYDTWEIFMVIHKVIDLDRVVNFLKAYNYWAYVYTQQHYALRHYFLHGYIYLQTPQTHDWFVQNLGEDGEYKMTIEDPNKYRARARYIISHPPFPHVDHTEILVKIDKRPYIPGTGPYMYNY